MSVIAAVHLMDVPTGRGASSAGVAVTVIVALSGNVAQAKRQADESFRNLDNNSSRQNGSSMIASPFLTYLISLSPWQGTQE